MAKRPPFNPAPKGGDDGKFELSPKDKASDAKLKGGSKPPPFKKR